MTHGIRTFSHWTLLLLSLSHGAHGEGSCSPYGVEEAERKEGSRARSSLRGYSLSSDFLPPATTAPK